MAAGQQFLPPHLPFTNSRRQIHLRPVGDAGRTRRDRGYSPTALPPLLLQARPTRAPPLALTQNPLGHRRIRSSQQPPSTLHRMFPRQPRLQRQWRLHRCTNPTTRRQDEPVQRGRRAGRRGAEVPEKTVRRNHAGRRSSRRVRPRQLGCSWGLCDHILEGFEPD